MRHTQQLAHIHHLSRRVLMIAQSENLYKVHVEIQSPMGRSELSYQFIPALNCDIQQAQDLAVDKATETFLGLERISNAVEETSIQLDLALKQEEPKQETKNAVEVKEESKPEVKQEAKRPRGSKKSGEESKQKEVVKTEEKMEEVESPFKEEKKAKSTAVPYDREDKASTASFASYITRLHNGSKEWKKVEGLKEFSIECHGLPFLEKDGSIHPEFDQKCRKFFNVEEDEASL